MPNLLQTEGDPVPGGRRVFSRKEVHILEKRDCTAGPNGSVLCLNLLGPLRPAACPGEEWSREPPDTHAKHKVGS